MPKRNRQSNLVKWRERERMKPEGERFKKKVKKEEEQPPVGLNETLDTKRKRLGRQQMQVLLKLNSLPIKRARELPTDIFKKSTWKKKIITEMSAGAALVETLAELGLSRSQHHNLMKLAQKPDQEFYPQAKMYAETINRGLELAEAWWLKAGREGLSLGKFFGSSLYYMNMKNRFGWAEKLKSDYGEETLKTLQDTIAEIAKANPTKKKR